MIVLDTEIFYLIAISLLYPCYILISSWGGVQTSNLPLEKVYNRNQTDFLKGICAVAIMFHHFTGKIEHHMLGPVYSVYMNAGYLAVAVFMMISGYCLMMQYEKKGQKYLNGFLQKRLLRIYVPFTLCTIFVGILNEDNVLQILWNMLTFNFTIESSGMPNATWFVIAILYFSIFFYFVARFMKKEWLVKTMFGVAAGWIIICLLVGVGKWWYNTAWAFPVGILVCKYRQQMYDRVTRYFLIALIMLMGVFIGTYVVMAAWESYPILQMICSTALALLTWVLCIHINFSGKIGRWIGGFTLELFLVHSAILVFFYNLGITNAGWSIYIVILLCIATGYLMNKLSSRVSDAIVKK